MWQIVFLLAITLSNDLANNQADDNFILTVDTLDICQEKLVDKINNVYDQFEYLKDHDYEIHGPDTLLELISQKKHPYNFTSLDALTMRSPKEDREGNAVETHKGQRVDLHLIITTNTNNILQVWDENQQLLDSITLPSQYEITSTFALSTRKAGYFAVGFRNGETHVYKIKTWRPAYRTDVYNLLAGEIQFEFTLSIPPEKICRQSDSDGETSSSTEDSSDDVSTSKESITENEDEKQEEEEEEEKNVCPIPSVTSIKVRGSNHRKYLIVYSDGSLHMYDKEGEWKTNYKNHDININVLAIGAGANSVIVTNNNTWRVIRSTRLKDVGSSCTVPEGMTIVAATFDVHYDPFVYLTTDHGTILVYSTKKLSNSRHCNLIRQYDLEPNFQITAHSIPNYFIAHTTNAFYVYNISGRLWTSRGLVIKHEMEESVQVAVSTFYKTKKRENIVVASGTEITVLRSHLPTYEESKAGSFNMGRFPVIIGMLVFFFGYQYFTGNKIGRSKGRKHFNQSFGGKYDKFSNYRSSYSKNKSKRYRPKFGRSRGRNRY